MKNSSKEEECHAKRNGSDILMIISMQVMMVFHEHTQPRWAGYKAFSNTEKKTNKKKYLQPPTLKDRHAGKIERLKRIEWILDHECQFVVFINRINQMHMHFLDLQNLFHSMSEIWDSIDP